MKLENVYIFNKEHRFQRGTLTYSEQGIEAVEFKGTPVGGASLIGNSGPGLLAIPGLVDIHLHGCMGADVSDAKPDSLPTIAKYQGSQGVTTICPATMTMPVPELHKIMQNVGSYREDMNAGPAAHIAGINMEGPFVSKGKKGAQAEDNIIPCDIELFRKLQRESGNRIKLVDIAPEEPGAMEFIAALKDEVVISVAHTLADYDTAREAFARGANHVTHLFNAMPAFHHRNPGVVGATADVRPYTELICDGVHVHPAMVRSMFKLIGSDRLCLISDSMRATGLPDGMYTLGGQPVKVEGHLATLPDGNIAASVTNLRECLQKVVLEMGVSLEEALESCTETPARSLGIFNVCGSLDLGKQADIVLLNSNLQVQQVIIGGRRL